MKNWLVIAALATACAAVGHAEIENVGLGVEVGKDIYLSVLLPLGGLTLQGLADLDRVSNGSDDDYIEAGAALLVPVTEGGDATLNVVVQGLYKSVTDFEAGYSALAGLSPLARVGEHLAVGGKMGLIYRKEAVPEGRDADTQIGLEGAVSIHWLF